MSYVLVYDLDTGLWGDEGMYSKEQRRRVRCAGYERGKAHCLTAISLPPPPKAEAGSMSWLPPPSVTDLPALCSKSS